MNRGFNHGSQGDFFENIEKEDKAAAPAASLAPAGVGEALREAAREGEIDKLTALVAKWTGDSVINEPDAIGTTALHTAAANGHVACVKLLLANGASKELKNCYGQTAYHKAKTEEIRELVKPVGVLEEQGWCVVM